jgi:hypothetical protein
VPQFVRAGLRTNRWLETDGRTPQDFPADVITDLKTTGDEISMFEVTESISAERIAIAIAAGKRRPDHTGYAVFERADAERVGITLKKSAGETYDAGVNDVHYDFHVGTAARLLELAGVIAAGEIIPILRKQVEQLLRSGFENGHLDHSKNKFLCDVVKARIPGQRDDRAADDEFQ